MIYQQWDIFRTLPQGWNVNRKNIQAVKQIFAKFLLLNHLSEVAIAGCDQTGIGVNSPCASQPLEFSLLEHTQQLGVQLDGNIPDLVEEYLAAVRQLEAADALCDGAGERAFLVTEQLAFKQACRYGRAVYFHQSPFAAEPQMVERAGNQLLTRTRFSHKKKCGLS